MIPNNVTKFHKSLIKCNESIVVGTDVRTYVKYGRTDRGNT